MRYHSDHHNYLGEVGKDADLPTEFEANIGKKNTLVKVIFLMMFPVIYVFRPLLNAPKRLVIDEVVNYAIIIFINVFIFKYVGPSVLAYMVMSGFLAISMHPTAGHTIAEHFEFAEGL
jgi:sphingolipid 4-desaturase/C4-monooxygenase